MRPHRDNGISARTWAVSQAGSVCPSFYHRGSSLPLLASLLLDSTFPGLSPGSLPVPSQLFPLEPPLLLYRSQRLETQRQSEDIVNWEEGLLTRHLCKNVQNVQGDRGDKRAQGKPFLSPSSPNPERTLELRRKVRGKGGTLASGFLSH